MKDRILSQHEHIHEALSREIGDKLLLTTVRGSTAKVHSRLLSSKVLATEITSFCDDLHKFLGHESKKSRVGPDGYDSLNAHEDAKNLMPRRAESSEPDPDQKTIEDVGWESGTVEEDGPSAAGWESGSISANDDSNASQVEEDEKEGEGENIVISRKNMQNTAGPSAATSTFLPSLSVGFIRGSNESDWSDNEAKIADLSKKKNRRGQRARRACVTASLPINRSLIIWQYLGEEIRKKCQPQEEGARTPG